MAVDDVVSVRTPGGGGYGDPLDRDPHKVADDLQDDRISAQAAEQVYGAVIRQGRLDEAATERLRSRLSGKTIRSEE